MTSISIIKKLGIFPFGIPYITKNLNNKKKDYVGVMVFKEKDNLLDKILYKIDLNQKELFNVLELIINNANDLNVMKKLSDEEKQKEAFLKAKEENFKLLQYFTCIVRKYPITIQKGPLSKRHKQLLCTIGQYKNNFLLTKKFLSLQNFLYNKHQNETTISLNKLYYRFNFRNKILIKFNTYTYYKI